MPEGFAVFNTKVPQFSAKDSPEQKITKLENGLHMVVRELRYTLGNLDINKNVNSTSQNRFAGSISGPLNKRIDSALSRLQEQAGTTGDIDIRVTDSEERLALLTETIDSITPHLSGLEESLAELTGTLNGVVSQISGLLGEIQTETQTRAAEISALDERIELLENEVFGVEK